MYITVGGDQIPEIPGAEARERGYRAVTVMGFGLLERDTEAQREAIRECALDAVLPSLGHGEALVGFDRRIAEDSVVFWISDIGS